MPSQRKMLKKIFGDKIEYTKDMYSCLEDADCLLIATEWSEFKNPNFQLMAEKMKNKAIFDGRKYVLYRPNRKHRILL